MMRELMLFELRKTCLLYTASLLVLFGYILFRPSPHGFLDLILVFIAFVHGALIGGKIFYDKRCTQAFIFTLPLTKARLFVYRFIYGILLITISIFIILVLLASGMRNVLQQSLDSLYFPYVIWYEFRVLYQIMLCTFFGYLFGMHTIIHAQLANYIEKNFSKYHNLFIFSLMSYHIIMNVITLTSLFKLESVVKIVVNDMFYIPFLLVVLLFSVCMPFYFYQHFEIDS